MNNDPILQMIGRLQERIDVLEQHDRLRTYPAEGGEGRDYAANIIAARAAATEELCAAFLSQHGCLPDEAEIVQQWTDGDRMNCRIFVRKRDKSNDPAPPPQPVAPERGEAKAVAWMSNAGLVISAKAMDEARERDEIGHGLAIDSYVIPLGPLPQSPPAPMLEKT